MGDEKVVGVSMCWGEDGEMEQVLGWGWGMRWVEDGNEGKRGGENRACISKRDKRVGEYGLSWLANRE